MEFWIPGTFWWTGWWKWPTWRTSPHRLCTTRWPWWTGVWRSASSAEPRCSCWGSLPWLLPLGMSHLPCPPPLPLDCTSLSLYSGIWRLPGGVSGSAVNPVVFEYFINPMLEGQLLHRGKLRQVQEQVYPVLPVYVWCFAVYLTDTKKWWHSEYSTYSTWGWALGAVNRYCTLCNLLPCYISCNKYIIIHLYFMSDMALPPLCLTLTHSSDRKGQCVCVLPFTQQQGSVFIVFLLSGGGLLFYLKKKKKCMGNRINFGRTLGLSPN